MSSTAPRSWRCSLGGMARALLLVALAACGRVGFDERLDAAPPFDATDAPPSEVGQLALGGRTSCFLRADGSSVYCWGNGFGGRRGDNQTTNSGTPGLALVPEPSDAIWAGDGGVCARAAEGGTIRCWGQNQDGQLGLGHTDQVLVPTLVPTLEGSRAIGFATTNVCGFDGTQVVCAGHGPVLGDGINVTRSVFAPATDGLALSTLVGGDDHMCGLTSANSVVCWGSNQFGQLGNGTVGGTSGVPIEGPRGPYASLVAGDYFTCGLTPDRTVECWGSNADLQLGDEGVARGVPAVVPNLDNVIGLAAGSYTMCALRTDRTVWCWGGHYAGVLGDGETTTNRAAPLPAAIDSVVQVASTTDAHFCALKTDGTVWCWGRNELGQLGIGVIDPDDHRAPEQVIGLP